MSDNIELTAEVRNDLGKAMSRRLRRTKKIPATLYGAGEKPQNITLDHDPIWFHSQNEAFYSHILSLQLGSKKHKVVVKEIQRHPIKHAVLHIDLLKVSDKHKIRVNIPLHFSGGDISPGVKLSKGIVTHLMTNVEVSCFGKDLPEFLEVDLSQLGEGESAHLSDIKLPAGVELPMLVAGTDQAVASIHVPRSVDEGEAAAAAAKAAAAATPVATPAAPASTKP